MNCPNDQENLEPVLFHTVEADYCPKCFGIWFDADELRMAKDDKDKQLSWIDVDLWNEPGKFEVSHSDKHCPRNRTGLMEVKYDNSKVKIDFCKNCQGVWLDRGEFKQIINYLRNKFDYELLHNYHENLGKELWEVFSGPEKFREELADFMMLLKLLNHKFAVQHPFLNSMIENAQK